MAETKATTADLAPGESISKYHINSGYAWWVTICVIFASLAYVMISRAVSPGMEAIITYFGMDTVWGGSLSSIMGMISAIVVLPLGAIATRFSVKWMAVIALALITAGAFAAAAVTDATLFYAARVVQGFGYGAMSVVGATVVTRWFDESHRGLPMGIYGANVGLGGFVINFTATPLMNWGGWQALFTFVGVWAAIGLVLYLVFVQDWPAEGKVAEAKKEGTGKKAKFTDTFKKPAIWILAAIFFLMGCGQQGMGVFIPMIITQTSGATAEQANLMNSAISICTILCTMIAGAIYGAVTTKAKGKRGLLVLVLVIVGALTQITLILFPSDYITSWIACVFFGLCGTMWMPGCYILAAEHSGPPELASMGLTIFMFGQYLGGAVGPIMIGYFNANMGGFQAVGGLVAVMVVIACVLAFVLMRMDSKLLKNEQIATTGEDA